MVELIGGGLVLVVLGVAAVWWMRRPAPSADSPPVADAPQRPAGEDGQAPVDAEALGRDWALPLVEMAFPADASGVDDGTELTAATERTLSRFASEPQRLPRRPQLLPQLLGTLNDDEASGREIAAVIARDPALAANLLKLANSPLYRLQAAPVESLDRAVTLVGTYGLRELVAVALMQPVMRAEGGPMGRLPELVWEHTQHAALEASRRARAAGEDPFAAQLLALLQGLGAIVVVQAVRDECVRLGAGVPTAARVAALLQAWAPRIGRLVAQEWELSARMIQALDDQALAELDAMGGLGRAIALAGPAAVETMRGATP